MEKGLITTHCLVRNEDKFVKLAILSVLPFVDKLLIYDTGSIDRTVEEIKSIPDSKIIFEERGEQTPAGLVKLRREQLNRTQTKFFMLLDGDEIWPQKNLLEFLDCLKSLPASKIALCCRTRNAVGDVYHYLPEDAGRYHLLGRTGHLTMRAFRNDPGLKISGAYPLENYNYLGRVLNSWEDKLQFCDTWYFHATHLARSSNAAKTLGFRSEKIEKGLVFDKSEIPEVLQGDRFPRRSHLYEMVASLITPFKVWRRTHA